MAQNQKILAAILSLLLAACTLFFIEYMHYADGIQQYLFVGMEDMSAGKTGGRSYLDNIKAVMVLICIFFVLYAIFFLLFFELLALAYFIFTSRWQKPRVFISYKNAAKDAPVDTAKIAQAIKKSLEQKGFTVLFFNYTEKIRHDEVNFEIQKLLRRAHAMVVVPDPYHPSYVDTEIQCAAYSLKPVYIIKHTKDQKLPNTANSGHTVLLLDKLRKEKFEPLSYLLQYVHRVWHKRLFVLGEPFLFFFETIVDIFEGFQKYVWALVAFVLATVLLVYFAVPTEIVATVLKVVISIVGVAGAYLTLKKIIQNINLQKHIRQSMLSAGNTFEYFQQANLPKTVLNCLDKVGLQH